MIALDASRPTQAEPPSPFLALFPHRWDFLYAEQVAPGKRPNWYTEKRYPLNDRLIEQGSRLYGVRFGPTTNYLMLDIDRQSPFHPANDRVAFERVKAALEPLGLLSCVMVTSSWSKGLHLYFPFAEAQASHEIALAAVTLLENRGLLPAPGRLEVFPNPRPYQQPLPLYNGHRLPLQAGSYLLNQNFEQVSNDFDQFIACWKLAEHKNDVAQNLVRQVLQASRRFNYPVSTSASQFLNDLNAVIEPGWSGPGQTQLILKAIAKRSYVFGHVLQGSEPLKGQALVDDIVRTARALPGFDDWCGHQHDLEACARNWARHAEKYNYPYGGKALTEEKNQENQDRASQWNEAAKDEVQYRITEVIKTLLEEERLPTQVNARFAAMLEVGQERFGKGFSKETLYKHKDLWHPAHLQPVENPPDPPTQDLGSGGDCRLGASPPEQPENLFRENDRTPLQDKGLSDPSREQQAEGDRTGPGLTRAVNDLLVSSVGGSLEAGDLSGLLTAISIQLDLLGWNREVAEQWLMQLFGKPSLAELEDLELILWFEFLGRESG